MTIRIFLFVFIGLLSFSQVVSAEGRDAFRSTNYPLPRFVSLSADEVYVRAGPGAHYPIRWVFQRKGLPVEIVREFDNWRQIRDFDGDEGWVHQSLLSGRRMAIIESGEMVSMRRKPKEGERPVAYIEPRAVAEIEQCGHRWCRLEASGYSGWVEKQFVWGVYTDEVVE